MRSQEGWVQKCAQKETGDSQNSGGVTEARRTLGHRLFKERLTGWNGTLGELRAHTWGWRGCPFGQVHTIHAFSGMSQVTWRSMSSSPHFNKLSWVAYGPSLSTPAARPLGVLLPVFGLVASLNHPTQMPRFHDFPPSSQPHCGLPSHTSIWRSGMKM